MVTCDTSNVKFSVRIRIFAQIILYSSVAQLIVYLTCNQDVVSLSLTLGSKMHHSYSWFIIPDLYSGNEGSNPS